jgi:hypothetical protein
MTEPQVAPGCERALRTGDMPSPDSDGALEIVSAEVQKVLGHGHGRCESSLQLVESPEVVRCPNNVPARLGSRASRNAGLRRRLSSASEGVGAFTEAPPEAALVEVVEVEVPLELGRSLVDGVDDRRLSTDLTAAADAMAHGWTRR